jgi:hypothetical protein
MWSMDAIHSLTSLALSATSRTFPVISEAFHFKFGFRIDDKRILNHLNAKYNKD